MSEQSQNLLFVAAVKKHPILYNTKLSDYGHMLFTEAAWREVGQAFDLTAMQARERWKNLRSVFVRNLKLQLTALKKSQYYLADAMGFVIPYIRNIDEIMAKSKTDNKTEFKAKKIVKTDGEFDDVSEDTGPASPDTDTALESSFIKQEISSPPSPELCDPLKQLDSGQKRKLSNFEADFNEYLQSKVSKSDGDPVSNANSMFLLSLLPDMNSMTPEQVRSFKRQVMDLMENIFETKSDVT